VKGVVGKPKSDDKNDDQAQVDEAPAPIKSGESEEGTVYTTEGRVKVATTAKWLKTHFGELAFSLFGCAPLVHLQKSILHRKSVGACYSLLSDFKEETASYIKDLGVYRSHLEKASPVKVEDYAAPITAGFVSLLCGACEIHRRLESTVMSNLEYRICTQSYETSLRVIRDLSVDKKHYKTHRLVVPVLFVQQFK
tara:strand:+ start:1034 stop:1618 length:585 start_codon:yes stop_codon:yes gene_type:complete